MVVDVGLTLMDVPVPTRVPPQLPVYHAHVLPEPPEAVKVLLAPEQIVAGLADADVGATGSGFTVTVVPGAPELQQPVASFCERI